MVSDGVSDEIGKAFHNLTTDLNKNLKQFASCVENLNSHLKNDKEGSLDFSKGISFLSMKNMLMVEYLSNLLQLCYIKTNGLKLSGQSCVNRLAETRCILEKTKSVEIKLKYQIDKLLKLGVSTDTNQHDPLSFKANTGNFAKNQDESDNEDADEKNSDAENNKSDRLYRPPKLVPIYNDFDETPEEKAKKQIEKIKRKAFNSSIIKDLEKEYSGAPEEIKSDYANVLHTESSEQRHKIEYEEENFVRKPLTKSEIAKAKRLQRGTNLNSLTSFDDARLLLDDNLNMEEFMKNKKEKKKSSKKSGKGKKGSKNKKKIRYT